MKFRSIRSTSTIRRKKKPLVKLNATAARRRSTRVEEFDVEEDEDDDSYYEASEPNMKLSHAFIVVLILHLIAVAGVFGFNAMKNRQNAMAKIAAEPGVPASAQSAAVEAASPAAPATGTAGQAAHGEGAAQQAVATHTVVAGDTLFRIAAKYNTTIEALELANGLKADSILRVGQVLRLPTAEQTAAAQAAKLSAASQPVATDRTNADAARTASQQTTVVQQAPRHAAPVAGANSASPAAPNATARQTGAAAAAPASSGSAARPQAADGSSAASQSADGFVIYEVKAGDNPYSIAKRHGVNYQTLLEINEIKDPTKLQIGQKLKIPSR